MTTSSPLAAGIPANGLLRGKVCVVSGVGPGLGRQAARALATHGGRIVLAARRQASLDEVAEEVRGIGADVITVPTDITKPEQCAELIARADDEFGGVDVLVNNAFRFDAFQTFEAVDLALWRKIMDVNLFGTLQMTRAALPSMRAAGFGRIILISSRAALGLATRTAYSATKAGMIGMARTWALELAPDGITVNSVLPGRIATDRLYDLFGSKQAAESTSASVDVPENDLPGYG